MEELPYKFTFDAAAGLLRVIARGFWDNDVLDGYIPALGNGIAQMRRRGVRVAVLIDACGMKPQTSDFGMRLAAAWPPMISDPTDRCAIVGDSPLAIMQFRRLFGSDRCRIFDAVAPAETWLLAEKAALGR